MTIDPYEEDVPDSITDVNDGNGGEDGFINQVESSPAWTSWRDNLAMEIMNGPNDLTNVARGRKKVVQNIRRVWTYVKEMELVNALKELVVKGNKCDNGFKTDYLLLLENMLANKFPGTNLKGDPHINSKIHTMLGNSGIGLNSTTYRINALPDVWEAHLKVDTTARSLKNKTFPFYSDWCDIFGNDRATGDTPLTNEFSTAEFPSFNVGESSSATKDKAKSSKRRKVDELQVQFMDIIGALCDKNNSKFVQIANTMGNIAE
ncbi:hypothetical protein ACS0TY_003675 [Phlomoides rotata]